MARLRIEGSLQSATLRDLYKFYPWLGELSNELKGFGCSLEVVEVVGRAVAEVDPRNTFFKAIRIEPDLHEPGCFEPRYELCIESGSVAEVEVLEVSKARLRIVCEGRSFAEIEVPSKRVVYVADPYYRIVLGRERYRLEDVERIVSLVSWLLSKGFSITSSASETLHELLKEVGRRSIEIPLELVVVDRARVPPYEDLLDDLADFFARRGLALSERSREGLRRVLDLLRKPIP